MGKVKTAILGFGHLGRWHVQKALNHELCDLQYVVDPAPESQKRLKEAHPDVRVKNHLEEVIDEVDAVIIATPTSFHFDLIKSALKKGKHVFCEKPMCSNSQELKELKGLKNDSNLPVFQVGHSERFHKVWKNLDFLIPYLEGDCLIHLNRVAPFKGRATDVDVVQDLMIHDLDILMMLLNEKPVSVEAKGFKMRTSNWDYVEASFCFQDKKTARIESSRNSCLEVRKMTVTNKLGQVQIDLMQRLVSIAHFDTKDCHVESFEYEAADHLYLEQDQFYKAILFGEKPDVGFDEGALAVELVDQVLECLKREA